ncbi:MAG TPA: hypothetical protein DCL86_10515 [Bacteroidales bacterium]|jgi:hypothetical protein|nr:hypothetical protein [Bacteroidales bacterium]
MGINPGTWAPAGGIIMHSMKMMVHPCKMVNGFMFSVLIGLFEAKLIAAKAVSQSNRMEGENQWLNMLNCLMKVKKYKHRE